MSTGIVTYYHYGGQGSVCAARLKSNGFCDYEPEHYHVDYEDFPLDGSPPPGAMLTESAAAQVRATTPEGQLEEIAGTILALEENVDPNAQVDVLNDQLATKETNPKDALAAAEGRASLYLIPPVALVEVSKAMADGAKKYGPYNWRESGVRATTYLSGALRHILALIDGEDCARDSGVHHAAHAMAGLAIYLDAVAIGKLNDDRPSPGAAPALMEAMKG